uniref:Uncharacterized protein n=1 Tax=Caulobacter sp. (strain K31) TaxID=366602 RepID=B0SWI8_CAUSK
MMEDVSSYWWLIFPLSWIVFGAFQSWLRYQARRDALDVLRSYAEAGVEPPAALVARLNTRCAH